MRSHPHDRAEVGLLVHVQRPRESGELGVLKKLASLPQVSFDLAVAAAAPLPLPGQATVNGPVPVKES